MTNKKPSLVGFKPTGDDIKKLEQLIKHFEKTANIPGLQVNNSQILRMALDEFHKKYIDNPETRYGIKR